jgi:ACT domain-containing protein
MVVENKNKQTMRTITTAIISGVSTALLTVVLMGAIAPNNLRNNMQDVKMEQVVRAKQMDINTGNISNLSSRIYNLESIQANLATKQDLQILKSDLIRELK